MSTSAPFFRKLSPTTTIYEPPIDAVSFDRQGPTTILICGWLDGKAYQLTRYWTKYNTLYPSARIILVTSTLTDITSDFRALFSPSELKQRADVPAKALLAGGKSGEEQLLVHAFSNGGAITLAAVSKAYRHITGTELPASAVIFDSLPGGDKFMNEYSRWVMAIAVGLPTNPLVRWPGQVLIAIMVILLFGLTSLLGIENIATKIRREVNDAKLINLKGKRLYIYSDADALVGANEVKEHAAECARKGWDVETVNFKTSGHVRHAILDPERYWNAVLKTWESCK